MEKRYAIWDFNGTLLDDLDASIAAVNDMLTLRGGPKMHRQWYYQLIETPIVRFYEKIASFEGEAFEVLSRQYNEAYIEHKHLIRLAPGSVETLETLEEAGFEQIILSSFEISRINYWLEYFDIGRYFIHVLGADNTRAESKVDRARLWLQGQQADLRHSFMIGDSIHDFDAAQAMGVPCVLVSYGHQSEADLRRCGAPVIGALSELIPSLSNMSIMPEASKR